MDIRSLGYRTDLIFPRFDGEVIDRGDYIVARTPSNPKHHWGNFLLFANPPQNGSLELWTDVFDREVGAVLNTEHIALGWDSPDAEIGEIKPFIDAGFRVDSSVVLTATGVHQAPKHNYQVEVRPIREDWEWGAVVENGVAGREPIYTEAGFREFKLRAVLRYRAMANAGLGAWLGAFVGDRLAGDLGVYVDPSGAFARYQAVGTHPDFRRQGICGRLVYAAARYAFDTLGAKTLVMVADPEYHAAKIYESVGFVPTERQIGICKW